MIFNVIIQLVVVSIMATSAMTWFSYAMSKSFRELYKEPVLLSYAIDKMKIELSPKSKKIWGLVITLYNWSFVCYRISYYLGKGYTANFTVNRSYIRSDKRCSWHSQLDNYF